MVIRTQRAVLRDRTSVTNSPPHNPHEDESQGCLCDSFREVGIEDEPVDDDELVQILGETEKSQEEFSIGGARLSILSSLVWDFLDSGSLSLQ